MRDFGSPVGLAGTGWLLLKNGMCKKKMSKTGFDFMKVSNSYLDNNKKHLMWFFLFFFAPGIGKFRYFDLKHNLQHVCFQ